MKKIFCMIVGIFMLSLVFAAQEGIHEQGTGLENPELMGESQGGGQGLTEGEGVGEGQKIQLQIGEHIGIDGQHMMIRQEANNQVRLEVGGKSAGSLMNINQEMVGDRIRLSTQLSNGRDVEIKVMPDVASETAMERLRLKTCSEESGCLIELKEVGAGEKVNLAYEVKTQRQSKLFGLFGAKMNVQAQVNAETGEVLGVGKPWWAFLASEPMEE